MSNYLFQSARLGFLNWVDDDLEHLEMLCADEQVMEYFPKPLSKEETFELYSILKLHFEHHNYTYFSTEIVESGEWLGFIGLKIQNYEAPFTPAVDIGYRLKPSAWGKGYATEGAKACLDFGFNQLNLEKIVSVCVKQNKPSERVMQKIGMTKQGEFKHPRLKDYPEYENCVWYKKTLNNNNKNEL